MKKINYKKLRESSGLTQSEVAKKIGMSLMGYQLIEREITKNPDSNNLKALEKLLVNNGVHNDSC